MKNIKMILQDVLIYIAAVYCGYRGFITFIRNVGYMFGIIDKWIGVIILYFVGLIFAYAYLKARFYRGLSRKGSIALLITCLLLEVVGIVFFIMNIGLYFQNLKYFTSVYVFPIDVIVLIIFYGFLDVLLIKDIKKNEYKEREKKGFVKGLLCFLFFFNQFFVFYQTFSFFNGFLGLDYLAGDYWLYYLVLMIMLILPFVNIIFIYKGIIDKNINLPSKVLALVSAFFVLVIIVLQIINPNFMVYSGKIFFPLDFFGNLVLGPWMLAFTNLLPLCFLLYRNKNLNK